MLKVYRINTKTKEIKLENLKEEYKSFGGRGLIGKLLNDEVDPKCDALGKENKVVICTSLFAGTSVPTAHRLSVGGKSPLTGGIKEANVGGNAGTLIAKHGIKMIILEDMPQDDKWYILRIDKDSNVELLPADIYVGLNNYALVEKIHEEYGEKCGVISIGVAGERGYKTSTLQVTDNSTGHPARAAARGGLGAVMGSKKIKAVVIEKSSSKLKVEYVDQKRFNDAKKEFIELIMNHPVTGMAFPMLGTPAFTDMTGPMGVLPVRNFSGEKFERLEEIESKTFVEKVKSNGGKTGVACQPGCIVRCSNIYKNSKGEFVTSGLEYETLALFGPNCDITNWDAIAEFDRLCDDFGVDTIDIGVALGICMDEGKIKWGDHKAALDLVREMMEGTEFGNILGQGAEATGKAIGSKRIPTVKGQAIAAYDPRNVKGLGVTYATSTMGADHTAGHTLSAQGIDPVKKEGQVEASSQMQVVCALVDNLMCIMPVLALDTPEKLNILGEMLAGIYGGEWNFESLMGVGLQTLALEKSFNKAAGWTSKDDRLPEFFYTEKSSATEAVFDVTDEELAQTLSLLNACKEVAPADSK